MTQPKEKNCLNPSCGKELKHTPGRRPKKYCNPTCRISHHVSLKREPKFVQLGTHNKKVKELQEKLEAALSQSKTEGDKVKQDMVETGTAVYQTKTNGEVKRIDPLSNEADILFQIKSIREEKIPKERDVSPLSRKAWRHYQQKRIEELQKQLTP